MNWAFYSLQCSSSGDPLPPLICNITSNYFLPFYQKIGKKLTKKNFNIEFKKHHLGSADLCPPPRPGLISDRLGYGQEEEGMFSIYYSTQHNRLHTPAIKIEPHTCPEQGSNFKKRIKQTVNAMMTSWPYWRTDQVQDPLKIEEIMILHQSCH